MASNLIHPAHLAEFHRRVRERARALGCDMRAEYQSVRPAAFGAETYALEYRKGDGVFGYHLWVAPRDSHSKVADRIDRLFPVSP